MRIWKLESVPDEYRSFNVEDESDRDIIKQKVDKGLRVAEWKPLNIESYDNIRIGDNSTFFGYMIIPLINQRAKDIFFEKFKDYIQPLSVIDCKTKMEYYLVNILNIIDGIDYSQSKFKKLSFDIIVDVTEYVFKDIVRDIPIFKIYLDGAIVTTNIFVNDVFKKTIEDNNLKGFDFIEVYKFD